MTSQITEPELKFNTFFPSPELIPWYILKWLFKLKISDIKLLSLKTEHIHLLAYVANKFKLQKISSAYYVRTYTHSNIWRKITTAEKLSAFIRNLLISIKQEKKILPLLSKSLW